VSLIHIIGAAAKLHESIGALLRRLERFVPLGITLPTPKRAIVDMLTPTEADLISLTQDLDGRAPLVTSEVSTLHLLRVSAKYQETIGAVRERLNCFAILGLTLPKVDPALANVIVTETDLISLSRDLDGKAPWMDGAIPAMHLLAISAKYQEAIGAAKQRLLPFARLLGLILPSMNAALENVTATETDVILFSRDLNGRAPSIEGEISPMHLVRASAETRESIGSLLQRFQRFVSLSGLTAPAMAAAVNFLYVTEEDLVLLSQYLNGREPWVSGSVGRKHVEDAAAKRGKSVKQTLLRLKQFAPLLGLDLSDAKRRRQSWF
jgi:hypothetical protein